MKKESDKGIQVISRAASILREVVANPDGMSLGQLATATGLARSTVQRIVDALEMEFLV
ncbi:helix-turn-helix domain-containing protein, partial [Escherichia coli]